MCNIWCWDKVIPKIIIEEQSREYDQDFHDTHLPTYEHHSC